VTWMKPPSSVVSGLPSGKTGYGILSLGWGKAQGDSPKGACASSGGLSHMELTEEHRRGLLQAAPNFRLPGLCGGR
jgi:hypothetical protein